jgi:YidC/Oxa1 family membrane protein insertase
MNVWFSFFYQPLINGLIAFYRVFGNLGWAIVALTGAVRLLLLPLLLPSLKAAEKMKELAPKLAKLKEKYGKDKQKFAQEQVALYREAGINPVAGLLPNILQIAILIALFQAFNKILGNAVVTANLNEVLYPFLKLAEGANLNLNFFYLNLAKPDLIKLGGRNFPGIFLILSALGQFLSAKLMMPLSKKQEKTAEKTPEKTDDFAAMMQTQSLYIFPAMTLLLGFSFPSGLVLYWTVFSLFNLAQQGIIKQKSKFKNQKSK